MRSIKELQTQLDTLTGNAESETRLAVVERELAEELRIANDTEAMQSRLNVASRHDKNIVVFQSQASTISYEIEQLEKRVARLQERRTLLIQSHEQELARLDAEIEQLTGEPFQ